MIINPSLTSGGAGGSHDVVRYEFHVPSSEWTYVGNYATYPLLQADIALPESYDLSKTAPYIPGVPIGAQSIQYGLISSDTLRVQINNFSQPSYLDVDLIVEISTNHKRVDHYWTAINVPASGVGKRVSVFDLPVALDDYENAAPFMTHAGTHMYGLQGGWTYQSGSYKALSPTLVSFGIEPYNGNSPVHAFHIIQY